MDIDEPIDAVVVPLIKTDEGKAVAFIKDVALDDIEAIEQKLIESDLNEAEAINVDGMEDKLCGELYARALRIPKGAFITGRLHKRPYIDIFISGDVTVKSFFADGSVEDAERVNSFRFFEGKPGRKRVLVAHEDTLWVTVDPTMASSLEECESDVSVFQTSDYRRLEEVAS